MKKLLVVGMLGALAVLHACKKENLNSETEIANLDCTTVTYANTIQPLVQASCSGSSCHGSGSNVGDYTTYAGLKNDADNGKLQKELLTNRSMPEGSTHSSTELGQWQCWLDAGAAND
jgi:hypothetical protein